MDEQKKQITIAFDDYKEDGLYLIFPDGTQLVLTRENVQKIAEEFWNDPVKISVEIKKAGEFQRCEICPLKGKGGLCDAIRPVFSLLEDIDKYVSFDKVIAIYKGDNEILHVADTAIQEALKYISILSLTRYCQAGRKYWKYFHGLNPLMNGKEAASRIYLNIYWFHKGEKDEINKVISEFNNDLRITSQDQVKRLNMVCKNDVFMNTFVNTQIATEFLTMGIDKILTKSFKEFEKIIVENL